MSEVSQKSLMDNAVREAPVVDIDLYSDEVQGNLHAYARQMRETAPVVWLSKYDVYYVTTYEGVRRCLNSWQEFSSRGGIGLIDSRTLEGPVRKGILVGTDPPEHPGHRKVLNGILSPGAIRKLAADYDAAAEHFVSLALAKGEVDMVSDVIRPFTVRVLADAVGIPQEGREHMLLLGEMILASVGPVNARYKESIDNVMKAGSLQWSQQMSRRESLAPNGFGAQIYAAVDTGELTEEEAALMVSLFLFGGIDTTITSLANGIKNLLDHPDQWALLSADPTLARDTFEEVLRFNVPVQQMYRSVAKDVIVDGVRVEAGKRIGIGIAAANRDSAKFSDPDRFDIRRKPLGHLAFGTGIHGCAGQVVARLEAQALYTTLAKRVARLVPAGQPERWISGGMASWRSLPVTFEAKAASEA